MTIQESFEQFHSDNPHVLTALEGMAAKWFEAGNSNVGIGMLFEAARWLAGISTTGDDYVLNNNYRSRYVRLLIERNPTWADRFRTRELRSA